MRRSCCGANCLAMQMPNQCIDRVPARACVGLYIPTCKSVEPVLSWEHCTRKRWGTSRRRRLEWSLGSGGMRVNTSAIKMTRNLQSLHRFRSADNATKVLPLCERNLFSNALSVVLPEATSLPQQRMRCCGTVGRKCPDVRRRSTRILGGMSVALHHIKYSDETGSIAECPGHNLSLERTRTGPSPSGRIGRKQTRDRSQ